MDISLLLIILVCALDVAVLHNVIRSKSTLGNRILYSLIILLIPVVGVSIYYLIKKKINPLPKIHHYDIEIYIE